MNISNIWQILNSVLVFILLLLLLALLKIQSGAQKRIVQRMRDLMESRDNAAQLDKERDGVVESATLMRKVTRRLVALGDMIPLLDTDQRTELGLQLTRGGFRERKAVSVLIGIKLSAGALSSFTAAVFASSVPLVADHFFLRIVLMGAAFIVGVILPETVLGFLVIRRQGKIATYLPDALDLLVICTNAGNSLPISIKRVSREMRAICPPLSDEFRVTADELQVDGDTAAALRHMSDRIGVQSMRSLVTTLIQSQQYGTPISQSLKTLSRSERNAQMMQLEEKAAKLAPKMTIPMMLFILPTVGIIAAGPAVLRLMDLFNQ